MDPFTAILNLRKPYALDLPWDETVAPGQDHDGSLDVGDPDTDGCASVTMDDVVRVWVGGMIVATQAIPGAFQAARERFDP